MKGLIVKNILIHIILVFFYAIAVKEIAQISPEKLETLVLFVGLIVIAPITSNFIYTYRGVGNKKALWFGHLTTAASMLVIGMLFVVLDVLLLEMVGSVFVFRSSILLFWMAVIAFDFADYIADSK